MLHNLRGISIYIIGMMGAGKTTVGELLAKELEYRFFDTDVLIERVKGQGSRKYSKRKEKQDFGR